MRDLTPPGIRFAKAFLFAQAINTLEDLTTPGIKFAGDCLIAERENTCKDLTAQGIKFARPCLPAARGIWPIKNAERRKVLEVLTAQESQFANAETLAILGALLVIDALQRRIGFGTLDAKLLTNAPPLAVVLTIEADIVSENIIIILITGGQISCVIVIMKIPISRAMEMVVPGHKKPPA